MGRCRSRPSSRRSAAAILASPSPASALSATPVRSLLGWRLACRSRSRPGCGHTGVLVAVGSLVALLPAIVFLGALLAARRPQALPLGGGLLAGIGLGLVGGFALAAPMMEALSPEIGLVALAAAAFLAVTLVGAAAGLADPGRRRAVRGLAPPPRRWLPEPGAGIVGAAAAPFATRPYLQPVEGGPTPYICALH